MAYKMNILEYYITHVFPTGWRTITSSFRIWCDLMTDNYTNYTLLKDDDPFEECYRWFWGTLGEDDVYPKEFLESLIQMADDVKTGKLKTYPMTKEMFEKLDDLVGDMLELDLDTELTDE